MTIEQKLYSLGRQICAAKEVFTLAAPLTGPVKGCFKVGVDTLNGVFYYKDLSGNWAALASGGGGSVALTTLQTSGPSTLVGSTLNVPDYTQYFTVTKAELDTAITNSTLIKGATYKVTGVHSILYNDGVTSGVTIYVTALETNKISQDGVGEFYNPKYNYDVNDLGIWNNISHMTASIPATGVFRPGETITANNGATATLISGFSFNKIFFTVTSGDWTTATSATNAGGVLTNLSVPLIRSYAIGAKVIYGGYIWVNNTGVVGTATNLLTLDNTNWSKIAYNLTDYNLVYDPIIYNYVNNIITKRTDQYNNTVQYEFADLAYFNTSKGLVGNPINVMQWGSKFCQRNLVHSSYLDCINTMGETQANDLAGLSIMAGNLLFTNIVIVEIANNLLYNNTLRAKSEMRNNVLIETCAIDANYLENFSTMTGNKLYVNARINASVLKFSCAINSNELRRAVWTGNILEQSCTINSNLSNKNTGHILANRLFRGGQINSNVINGLYTQAVSSDRAYIYLNTLTLATINSNTLNVGFNSRGAYINNNILIGDTAADTQIRTSAINSCTVNGVTGTTYIRMCQLRASQIVSANIDNATNDFRFIDLEDYVWTFSVPSTLSSRIDGVKISRDLMTASFTKVFTNTAGNGAIGNIIIPAIQVPSGAFIEEVTIDVKTTISDDNSGRGIINFGVAVDSPNSGINDTTGIVDTLNGAGITKILKTTFNKTTAARNIIMSVKDANLTGGEVKITVKILKTI